MNSRMCSKRGRRFCFALFITLSTLALALPSAGRAIVNIEGHTPEALPDYDSRASVAPSADQLAAANALGANVDWNRFGVASSVSKTGAYVTTGLQATDAVSAARNWLAANKALFRLDSTDSLAAVTTQPFRGTTNDYAIVFRQVADGVGSTDGVATVALVGSKDAGWNVTYASSSLTGGSTDATGSDDLSPAEAWTEAANNVGVDASVVDIAAQSTKAGATTLAVHGLAQTQRVTKAVFATPHHGARAAYDASVTTNAGGNLESYQVVVDAETGDVLYRQSQVDYISDNPTWLAPRHSMPYNNLNAFPWNYPTTDNRAILCWTRDRGMHRRRWATTRRRTRTRAASRRSSRGTFRPPRRASPGRPTRRGETTSTTPGCGAAPTSTTPPPTGARRSSARRARPVTTSRPSRTPGTCRAATRTTSTPRSTRPATTSRPRRSLSSSATTSCTTGRTTSASTRGTGTRSSTTTASRRSTRRRRRAVRWSRPARQRRAARKRPVRCCDRQPRQREHGHRRRRPAPDDEPVRLAAARRLVLRAVRRRRVRLRRLRPRVRPPDREPHDRQGRRRPPGHARRLDGRGVRRLRRAGGLQRAAPAGPAGRGPLHRGRVRHRQRLQRHPRLPRGPSDGRRVPGAGPEPGHGSAELRRLRLRQRRPRGARRRRDLGRSPDGPP